VCVCVCVCVCVEDVDADACVWFVRAWTRRLRDGRHVGGGRLPAHRYRDELARLDLRRLDGAGLAEALEGGLLHEGAPPLEVLLRRGEGRGGWRAAREGSGREEAA